MFSLEVGNCFNDGDLATGQEISDVPLVECSEPHDNEIFFNYDVPDGDFPGNDALTEIAQENCLAAFEGYVGKDFQTSSLDISWLTPTSDSWDQGDQRINCLLYDLQFAKLTGSAKDSGL